MAAEQIGNLAVSTLSAAIVAADTSLPVVDAGGFPLAPFRALITDGTDNELVKVTAVSGTTFTVTRGIESTTASDWPSSATIKHILTAGALKQRAEDLMLYDTFANRPAAGVPARIFYASDTDALYRDNGSTWDVLMPVGSTMGAAATRSTTQAIASGGSGSLIQWTDVIQNDLGALDLATHNTRFTAPSTGWYAVEYSFGFTGSTTGSRAYSLRLNGGTQFFGKRQIIPSTSSDLDVGGSALVYLTAGDYLEALFFQSSGGSLNVKYGEMAMVRLG